MTKSTEALGVLWAPLKFLPSQQAYAFDARGDEWEARRKVASIFAQSFLLRWEFVRELPPGVGPPEMGHFVSSQENFH